MQHTAIHATYMHATLHSTSTCKILTYSYSDYTLHTVCVAIYVRKRQCTYGKREIDSDGRMLAVTLCEYEDRML